MVAEPIDLLVIHGLVVTMDRLGTLFEDGAVAVRGADIVAVGATEELVARYEVAPAQLIDARGQVVLPGLVNLHTHGGDCLFRGLIDDLPLEPWLERLWAVERSFVNPQTVRLGSSLAYAEMIRGGTTTALDMFFFPEEAVAAAREIGFRLLTGPVFFDSTEIDGLDLDARLGHGRELIREVRRDPLITPCVLPHSTYTVSPEGLRAAQDLANEEDVLLSTHLSETVAEVETVRRRTGRTPPQHLDALGLLHERSVLAHGVHLEAEELGLLAARRSVVAHCPLSNLKLGSGIAPLRGMREAGVRLGLGTDGPASGNDLDMWLAMRLAAVLHKGALRDPSFLRAEEVVRLATADAATALGLEHRIGSLEAGKRADLVLVGLDCPHLVPLYDVYSQLVYAVGRGDVVTTIIHGRVVMHERELLTVDEDRLLAQVRDVAETIRRADGTGLDRARW